LWITILTLLFFLSIAFANGAIFRWPWIAGMLITICSSQLIYVFIISHYTQPSQWETNLGPSAMLYDDLPAFSPSMTSLYSASDLSIVYGVFMAGLLAAG